MSINALYGQANARDIVRLVRENDVAVLAVQEHSAALERGLTAAGLDDFLPHRVSKPESNASGSALYSRFPLQLLDTVPGTEFQIHTVRTVVQGPEGAATAEFTNVHAMPPIEAPPARWRSDLARIAGIGHRSGNQVLLGDFNATYDHAEFRRLLDGDSGGKQLVDVGVSAGARLSPTWPMRGFPLPGIVIDHIVTSPGIRHVSYDVRAVEGSDHAAVLAELRIPVDR
ncbi:endonuclease/exonuclease/phosphatase family protein [Arthrobacter sp. M4]|uniref:endonuclease/exonuclease/phosphatase family protein n=1 Tax=Arthrobacter sp. M4 TaxID=218160 RepID=UPI001CDC4AE2|nr:endonuclease/exonuclease/phosphatase family protein [Arthrobacter sp. M4]MCA4131259.1 endonuclease/exonuclease/phosphatase family protein [Arthrobacter sp. M4]